MRNLFILCIVIWMTGCSTSSRVRHSTVPPPPATKGGGYYLDDGPGDKPPADLKNIPDAVPRQEPPNPYANRPYQIAGVSYVPVSEPLNFRQQGIASWYGKRFHGKPTSSGETYNMYAMTAAHPTLPIPSYAKVTSVESGKSVIVRINDRGPFHSDRVIDLSYTAAYKLGFLDRGSAEVIVESIGPQTEQIQYNLAPEIAAKPDQNSVVRESTNKPGFYVQLGAFGNPENAQKLLARARETLDIPAQLAQVTLVSGLHRVKLGPFANLDEAKNWVENIHSVLGISAITLKP